MEIWNKMWVGVFFWTQCSNYLLYFTRRVSIVTAVRFVIVDFEEMNEWMTYSCFYPRDAMLARVIVIATCPSVCPSVTRRYCVKTKKASGMIFFTIW